MECVHRFHVAALCNINTICIHTQHDWSVKFYLPDFSPLFFQNLILNNYFFYIFFFMLKCSCSLCLWSRDCEFKFQQWQFSNRAIGVGGPACFDSPVSHNDVSQSLPSMSITALYVEEGRQLFSPKMLRIIYFYETKRFVVFCFYIKKKKRN